MAKTGSKTGASRKLRSAHIRFSVKELERIQKDSQETGESVPRLHKRKYFTGRVPRILLSDEQRRMLMQEILFCKTTLAAIRDRVDSGYQEGWHIEAGEVAQRLSAIQSLLVAVYGDPNI